ncbi:class I SAM-dependent methyltransferase [Lusitaniella coriacea]|uniref:class I SAM-dependent methyltransferase n=1 Tax=Lusitaniella coriacea TaxID=1983105 RepID=UPI003CF20128
MPTYDTIGQSYSQVRRPDSRIVSALLDLLQLEPGSRIADIGAGTGNYSEALGNCGFCVFAVEPSPVMRLQATKHPNVQWLDGYAEKIPLPTSSVDAAIAILATHHFSNLEKAISEMNRITNNGTVLFLTFDPRQAEKLWIADYFPAQWEEAQSIFPPLCDVMALIQKNSQRIVKSYPFLLPHDLKDLFFAAGWRRPEIYLNPDVRAGISALALADPKIVQKGIDQLQQDLENGVWDAKYGEIRQREKLDAGYRFLCASSTVFQRIT